MHTEITIQIGKKKAHVLAPDSWNDLDKRSLLLYYETLFGAPGPEHRQTVWTMAKLLSMVQHILKIDHRTLILWETDCRAAEGGDAGSDTFAEEVRQVVHAAIGGLFEIKEGPDGTTSYAVRYNLTRNPYPRLSVKKRGKEQFFLSAADELANVTIYELAACFTAFENYLDSNDEADIDTLLAILYRPRKPRTAENLATAYEGDPRLPYRRYEARVPERALMMKTLPPLVRRVLVFWFAGCRQAIVDAYPLVFRRSGKAKKNQDFGWGATLLAIAEGPVGLETVADQHFANALTWLSMKQQEAEEHEARLAEMRRKRR